MNKENKEKNIEEKILDRISKDNIKPKPKWEFLLTNNMFWFLGVLTVILGSLTIAASIYVFENIRWEFYEATHDNLFVFFIEFVPYLWIVLFVLFLIFSYYFIKKTKNGYKYDIKLIAGLVLLISVLCGIILSNLGFISLIDEEVGEKIPLHIGIVSHNYMIWNKPDKGLLVGTVSYVDDNLILTNSQNEKWNLIIDDLDQVSLDLLNSSNMVRVIGVEKDDNFHACIILPNFGSFKESSKARDLMFERKKILERNIRCEGIRPYDRLLED